MKKPAGLMVLMLSLFMVINSASASAWFWKKSKQHKHYDDVKAITKEDLSQKIESGNVQVVNVLNPDNYKLGMIKGSLKIPLNELDNRIGELDKTKEVVTYCASYKCGASKEAAHKLAGLGFNVWAYEGGIKEWKEAGLPTD